MNDDIRDQLAKGYEAIENAKACFDKAKEMLDAKDAAPPRNWPERIEAGDCFEDTEEGKTWLCCGGQTCVCVIGPDVGVHAFGFRKEWAYRGRDILTIRTEAHEPTGVELVGILEDIRNVSNHPGRTLTHLGLTECLQSCNVMARLALEKFAR